MISLLQVAVILISVLISCLAMGSTFRRAALGPSEASLSVVDLPLGYAFTSVILVFSLRWFGGLIPGTVILAIFLVYSTHKTYRSVIRLNTFGWPSLLICASFIIAVAMAYTPLLWAFGTVFQPPQIYDAPKHILTITALQSSASWPPQNPFMPGLGFAYNFGFYVLPAAVITLIGDGRLAISLVPCLAIISATFALLLTLSVAEKLGTSRASLPLVALSATWLGGFTPFLLSDHPPLGFRLYSEGIVTRPIWADEPFISAIFAPQHLFAATCVLATLSIALSRGAVWRRALLATVLCLAASLSSLILIPHISVILSLTVLIMARECESRRQITFAALAVLAYAVLLLPFFLDAVHWQSGTGGSVFGLPPDVKTVAVLFLSIGPVLILAIVGAQTLYGSGSRANTIFIIVPLVTSILGSLLLQYSEAPFKSTLLLRTILPCLAGLGAMSLCRSIRFAWAKAFSAVLIASLVAINAPTTWFFAAASLKPFSASERNFLSAMQTAEAPIVFDGLADQWLASLAAKQTVSDFRPFRTDAYLPPDDRRSYSEFFDQRKLRSWDDYALGSVVATPDRAASWTDGTRDTTTLSAMGLMLIRKRN
ncbi:hypothetical protein AAIH46_09665 [Rhizobium sp. 0TCS1.26]|uniref:hypothetical protein n=1 Tax=Rhizobium sp. 0TCS1.26 TaxID=3142623 RepID=UPI003D286AF2